MRNLEHEARYFWLTVIVIVLVLFALLVFPKIFRSSQSSSSTTQTTSTANNQTLSDLLTNATIQFPDVVNRSSANPSTVPTQVSLFLNSQGNYYAGQFLQYASSGIGFYFRYSLPTANAAGVFNGTQSLATSGGWTVLYAATSTEAAVLEVRDSLQQTVYLERVTYENQPDGSVMVIAQTLMQ